MRAEGFGDLAFRLGVPGRLGGSVGWASDFGSGHDLAISWSMSSSPASGSGLMAQSLEPASISVSPSLSLLLPRSCSVSLSVSKINKR